MKILVVGAGIAGSAVAHMLTHDGHDVLMVDAVEEPCAGGYQIVLDPAALDVIDQMGVLPVVHELSAPSTEVTVHRRGKALTTLATPGNRLARRGDLVGAISRHAARSVPLRFGCRLIGIEQTSSGVTARFADDSTESFDLLIGADGLNSTVRRLALEVDGSYVYDNGRIILWVDVPGRVNGTEHSGILLGQRSAALLYPYPDADESLVVATFPLGPGRHRGEDLLPLAADLLSASGPEFAPFVGHVLAAPEERIRVTRFAQVRAPRWHARNVVLIGDAAHCIDPLSGAGAHGGLIGAALLVEELRRAPHDIAAAAARYTRRARPFVRSAQLLTAGLLERATSQSIGQRLVADRSILAAGLTVRRSKAPQHIYTP
jgi:2-polyprenyl-6-methoxyphenol hydroxylase-like FAD-dependent oxidoreductase